VYPLLLLGIPFGIGSGCCALGAAGTEALEEYPNGGSESPSPAAGLEVRNLLALKGSALFFASFFKEKKEDNKIEFRAFDK
jgi:hypothetical protein